MQIFTVSWDCIRDKCLFIRRTVPYLAPRIGFEVAKILERGRHRARGYGVAASVKTSSALYVFRQK